MSRMDRYIGVVLFSFGLVICAQSFAYPFGSLRSPGAGFFPLFFSLLLMTLAMAIVVHTFIQKSGKVSAVSFFPEKGSSQRVLCGILSLLAFRYILPRIGLAPTTFLFVFFLGRYLAHYGWKANGALAVTAAALSYFIFQFLLKIPFPTGVFGF